jgi:hypothetical protein
MQNLIKAGVVITATELLSKGETINAILDEMSDRAEDIADLLEEIEEKINNEEKTND